MIAVILIAMYLFWLTDRHTAQDKVSSSSSSSRRNSGSEEDGWWCGRGKGGKEKL